MDYNNICFFRNVKILGVRLLLPPRPRSWTEERVCVRSVKMAATPSKPRLSTFRLNSRIPIERVDDCWKVLPLLFSFVVLSYPNACTADEIVNEPKLLTRQSFL